MGHRGPGVARRRGYSRRRDGGRRTGRPISTLFLDLDGVILDVSRRYFALHREIGGQELDFKRFWELKRGRASIETLCGLGSDAADEYGKRWRRLVEAPAYLAMDVYLPHAARTTLSLLAERYETVIVTLRRNEEALRTQLAALELDGVAGVLSATPRGDPSATKAALIKGSQHFTPSAVIVGDTEVDIRSGKSLGLATVGVLSGLRDVHHLRREAPDLLLDGIAELPAVLPTLSTERTR